jgi:uncharacterized membrane protein (UPF0182 family)
LTYLSPVKPILASTSKGFFNQTSYLQIQLFVNSEQFNSKGKDKFQEKLNFSTWMSLFLLVIE